nr:MAG TPA: hypothetical protein [Caudoviricetes sp.]
MYKLLNNHQQMTLLYSNQCLKQLLKHLLTNLLNHHWPLQHL